MISFSIETKKACHTGLFDMIYNIKYVQLFDTCKQNSRAKQNLLFYYFQRRKIRMRILLIEHPNLSKYFKY